MTNFAVTLAHGPGWDTTRPIRSQDGRDEHAAFMDSLIEDGFLTVGGPLGDGARTLHLVQGTDEAEVRDRFGADPWAAAGMLESQNIRWSGEEPLAVHNRDSAIAQPEAAIVGLAAAVWPAGGPASGGASHAATVAQSADFIASYQAAAAPGGARQITRPRRQRACGCGCSTPRRTLPSGIFPSSAGCGGDRRTAVPGGPLKR